MSQNSSSNPQTFKLSLGALGVVYGDLGTSPLYTLKECFHAIHPFTIDETAILGILSLIFWSITLVISLKYVFFIMRANNNGEGGILALMALAMRGASPIKRTYILWAGILGGSLFFGDALITPAISVLSALEGLTIVTPGFSPYIVPVALSILFGFFAFQYRGTGEVGRLFGPVMALWFCVIGSLGAAQIILHPQVMKALSPLYAVHFLWIYHSKALSILGASFLALTGAEALYADMGHFGKKPIQKAWIWLVFPCLILNYFGQGAVVLSNPSAGENPFYSLAPSGGIYPLIMLSTIATIVASQAVISGAYSICRQAIQLGYLPRLKIVHTSNHERGQIYIPQLNHWIALFVMLLVLQFQSSGALASAYGVAVSGIMVTTTVLTLFVSHYIWKWSWILALSIFGGLLMIDIFFFLANLMKIGEGGWIPLLIAFCVYGIMATWKKGRDILLHKVQRASIHFSKFISYIQEVNPIRVPGTAIFMSSNMDVIPEALIMNLKHNKVLHARVLFLSIVVHEVPYVMKSKRIHLKQLGDQIYCLRANYGFKQHPHVVRIFEQLSEEGLHIDMHETTFFLSRGIPVTSIRQHLPRWQEALFIFLSRNATSATEFFTIPHNQVMELRIQFRV